MTAQLMHKLPQLLTRKETAAYLRVTERTVDNLRIRGELKATKVGGRVLIPAIQLKEMVEVNDEGT